MKVIIFNCYSEFENKLVDETVSKILEIGNELDTNIEIFDDFESIKSNLLKNKFQNEKVLFIIPLTENGINLSCYKFMDILRSNKASLRGTVGGIITISESNLFTKSVSRDLAFSANCAGITLIGKSLVEKVKDFNNFKTVSNIHSCTKKEAFLYCISNLTKRLIFFNKRQLEKKNYKVLALHTSHFQNSNTLNLWRMVRKYLNDNIDVCEINLDEKPIQDCRGCQHETCMHFAKESSCYYSGFMVNELYPKVIETDAIVLICPNYNDSTGANITAFINRLTALYKTHNLEGKYIFAVVVSGYSGGDIVASQILGAFNMNKGFILPANFSLTETANFSGEIFYIDKVENKAKNFAKTMCETLSKS